MIGIATNSMADGRFIEANDRFCAMTGYDKAELGRFVGDPNTVAWLPKTVDPGTAQEVEGYSPNDNDPDGPKEPGELPEWATAPPQ